MFTVTHAFIDNYLEVSNGKDLSPPGACIYCRHVCVPAGFTTARSTGLQLAANGLENISISLSVARINEEVTVSEFLPLAATLAPSQSSLDARSAQSVISPEYIQNFTSPTADYTEVVQMAPGTFSFSPNGPG